MAKLDLNSARSYVGHNVNLHLKDGSVIINVLVTDVQRSDHKKGTTLCYNTPTKRVMKIHLKEIEWAEMLNPYLFMALTAHKGQRARHKVTNPSN